MRSPELKSSLKLAIEYGLNENEYRKIHEILGRAPSWTELGVFSVLWSEHCSYKNSIAQLKTLPRSGGRLLVDAGEENAGLVDIGDGLAIAFKIESHNHPSAVEPYQGAATGVGGIMRDIFTMGARPIASLNSLRFPAIDHETTKWLVDGVVRGIGDYGNCMGIPTVGGEVVFDPCYNGNPLVNAMTVGIVKADETASATAEGPGNPVFLMGASTGRDGIHGATFASVELTEQSEENRSSVQVGDPFMEKLLLEATLELIQAGDLVGIQDMGAAGITCSSAEMSAKGQCGIRLDIDKVPKRETGMNAYEVLLSESQERMLVVMKKGHEESIYAICKKWEIHCCEIGVVTDTGRFEVFEEGVKKVDIPSESLVLGGGAPVYTREWKEPVSFEKLRAEDLSHLNQPVDLAKELLETLSHENVASRRWIIGQYDFMIGTATEVRPGGDAAVVRIKGTDKHIATCTDCRSEWVMMDPCEGTRLAVAEAARNVAMTGAMPLAITNCLNFGNPYDPEIYWQFRETIRGMGEACRHFETPVTGGNVSFYNESPKGAVHPTPVIGMMGLLESAEPIPSAFRGAGDQVILLGSKSKELGGSLFSYRKLNRWTGTLPKVDLNYESRLHAFMTAAVKQGLLRSAHDVAEGGLITTLAECCLCEENLQVGLQVSFRTQPDTATLFAETPGLAVVSCLPEKMGAVSALLQKHELPFEHLGTTGDRSFCLDGLLEISLADLADAYWKGLDRRLGV
jgi:phosphoribosylformylglycinamidine synthase subunit PurL